MSIQWNPVLPTWLTWLLLLAMFVAFTFGTLTLIRKQVAGRWVRWLTALRIGMLVTFLAIVLQPVFTYSRNVPQLPEMLILMDTSRSMAQSASESTRLDEVRKHLRAGELATTLRGNHHGHWFAFSATAKPIRENDIADLKPDGATTDIASSIDAACTHMRAIGKTPTRIVLATDGNDHGSADALESARRWGVVVDVLAPSDTKNAPPLAVMIADVQSARRVLLGSDTHFRVTLSRGSANANDATHNLRVTEDGKKLLDQPIVFKAGRTEQTVLLTHKPTVAGLKQFGFSLAGAAKDVTPFTLPIQVLDSKYEVLILEDRWRWEYKYLHRLFEDDPSFRFSAMLNRGGGAFVQFASPDRRVNLVGFPQSRADLEAFDTFVLGDVKPDQWPHGLAADLARLITDDGKSLVVIAGPNLHGLVDIPELHAILPVELTADSGKPIDGPVAVRQREDGANSPFFFQLRAGDDGQLPPVDHVYPVLRKRPGATVLLEAAKERNPFGNLIVIAEHAVGRGRVLFIGTDTLWKWHTLAPNIDGPTPYAIFWQQAFRAMTPTRTQLGAVNLWLTPDRTRVETDRPVVLHAEVQSARSVAGGNLQSTLTLPSGQRVPLVFMVDPANPKIYRTEFSCTETGTHQIQATWITDGKVVAEAMTTIQVEEGRKEDADTGIDWAFLSRLTQGTGGKLIDPAQRETWPTSDARLPAVRVTSTIDPWGNFTLLLLLCAFLAGDWFIRLFNGLVSG